MIAAKTFEEEYLALRKKENRVYTDDQVTLLPEIDPLHPHYKEWQMRKRSCRQLVHYLINKGKQLNILEVGCGNGWLCSHLAKASRGTVTGIDINKTELEQAKRVFAHLENLRFLHGGLEEIVSHEKFDVIIFAASIQYFPTLDKILPLAFEHLDARGEIHILDSHFYKPQEVEAARQRSGAYYQTIHFPGMSNHYFHHSIEELKRYDHKILHNPNYIIHQIMKNKNPFYWICIYPHA